MTQSPFLANQRGVLPYRVAPRGIHIDKVNARLFRLIANPRVRLSLQKNRTPHKLPHDTFSSQKSYTEAGERKGRLECTFGKGFPESNPSTEAKKPRQDCPQLQHRRLIEHKALPCMMPANVAPGFTYNSVTPKAPRTAANEIGRNKEPLKAKENANQTHDNISKPELPIRIIRKHKPVKAGAKDFSSPRREKRVGLLPIRDYYSGKPLPTTKDGISIFAGEVPAEAKRKVHRKTIVRSKPRTQSSEKRGNCRRNGWIENDVVVVDFTFGKKLPAISHRYGLI